MSSTSFLRADTITGFEGQSRRDLIEATRRGIPVARVEQLMEAGRLTLAEIERTIVPRKLLDQRRKIGTLTPEQSDRLVRVVRVIAAAEDTFGTPEKAAMWLRRPSTALGGDAPLMLLDTSEGGKAVEDLLHRVDHGLAV